jgi:hypothetical protein
MTNPIHSKLIHTVKLGDNTVQGKDQDRLLDMYVFLSDPDKMLRSNMESLVDLYVSHMMWSMDELLN